MKSYVGKGTFLVTFAWLLFACNQYHDKPMIAATSEAFTATPPSQPITASPLTPLLITNHFGGDALQLGWWLSSFSAGTVLGGLTLGAWGGFKRKIVTAQLGLVLAGLSTTVIGIVPADKIWIGLAASSALGFLLPIINGSFGATLQSTVAPQMQGRVFAFIFSAAMLVSPLALMIAGPFADAFGIQIWFLIAGISCTLMGITGFFLSDVMNMENKSKEDTTHFLTEPS